MKKLFFSVMALLAATSMATAGVVDFSLPGVTEGEAGQTVVVTISAVGDGALQGMNLTLEVAAPLEIVGLPLAGGFATNNTGWDPILFANGAPTPQVAMGSTTTMSGTVPLGPVADIHVLIPEGTELGDYFVRTEIPDFGFTSDWAGSLDVVDGAQGAGVIRVVPEPATALLLLGAIPFLRRRSA